MDAATIDIARACLVARGLPPRRVLPFAAVQRLQATRLASLADEIGLVAQGGLDARAMYVRETDPAFAQLADHFGLAQRWGADWIARAEQGEVLVFDV
jgi:hypothetical protein